MGAGRALDYLSAQNLQTYALVAIVGLAVMVAVTFWRRRQSRDGALLSMVLNNMTQGVVLFDALSA